MSRRTPPSGYPPRCASTWADSTSFGERRAARDWERFAAAKGNRPQRVCTLQMAITSTQQGVITEAEFAKICILTSNGRLIPTRALADDDRRDFEIHIRRHFGESLAVQLKTARRLRLHGRSRRLLISC